MSDIVESSAVTKQPSPSNPTSTPLDLGFLNEVLEIVVQQSANVFEMARGTEEPNRYVIKDKSSGDQLYSVFEGESGSEICCQQCCGGHRPFNLTLVDKFKREIIKIKRSSVACDCCCGLMDCCDRVEVYVRNYKTMRFDWKLVGSVRKYWCPLFPYFGICNENGDQQFVITGPILTFGVSSFNIKREWNSPGLGLIRKEWSGLCREFSSDYDLFSLRFPPGVEEEMKATLIGALFLIDFKFFETCCN